MNDSVKQPRHIRYRIVSYIRRLFKLRKAIAGQKDPWYKLGPGKIKSSPSTGICKALPEHINSKSVSEAEKWFINELLALQKKNLKHKSDFKINGSSTLLVNFYPKGFEATQLYESLILLKNSYLTKELERDALRMLELAAIFKRPADEELKWGLSVAAKEKITSGIWLGEAAQLYTSNGYNEDCKKILEESANKGNGLSRFILTHC